MDAERQKQLEDLYLSRVLPVEKPKRVTTGQKIMGGLEDALKFLNTGSGGQLAGLLAKNQGVKEQIVSNARAKIPADAAAESEAAKLEMDKTRSIGDLLSQQAAMEQQNKILEATLGGKREDAEIARQEKEKENQAKIEQEIKQTARDEQLDIIDKSGLSSEEKLKAKEMVMQGITPEIGGSAIGKLSFGLLGSKEKLKNKAERSFNSVEEAESANLPKGTRVKVGNKIFEVE